MNQISCPSCQKAYQLDESHYGRSFQCTCGAMVSVPPKATGGASYGAPPPPRGDSGFSDFISFRRMVTPVIIQIVFWLGVLACIVGGIAMLADEMVGQGLLTLFLGPLMVRIYCEILIVVFTINETLTDIKNNTAK